MPKRKATFDRDEMLKRIDGELSELTAAYRELVAGLRIPKHPIDALESHVVEGMAESIARSVQAQLALHAEEDRIRLRDEVRYVLKEIASHDTTQAEVLRVLKELVGLSIGVQRDQLALKRQLGRVAKGVTARTRAAAEPQTVEPSLGERINAWLRYRWVGR